MKNLNMLIRIGADDDFKLEHITKKTGLSRSEVIRILINMLYHDMDPPFREFSS